jgi:hypothetical protein
MRRSGPRTIDTMSLAGKTPRGSLFERKERTVTTMADPPNKTDSITVDELLGLAYDAYARARSSPDASTKQKLMRVADGYLKQAKEMRRGRNSSDRFSNT